MANELWQYGATELAELIRSGKATSREVVEAHLARIEAVNPALNAVTVVLAEQALDAAADADRVLASGEATGPLHGVPVTVKENIDLAGSPTTEGLVALAEAAPPLDAPHLAQLRAAGAIPIGRTNLPDLALRWHTDNVLRGPTRNPWDSSRTPGGSSGGDAAALATGMTPLGLGNDYGGSLRWPSQCCGTTAIRPTLGRVPYASALPPEDWAITIQLFAVQGPMARHVRDLRLALASMSGPSPRDPWWTPAPLEGPPPAKPIKIAVTVDPAGGGVHPDIVAAVRSAAAALADAGYAVEEVQPPMLAEARDLWAAQVVSELQVAVYPLMKDIAGPDALAFLDGIFAEVPALDYAGYVMSFAQRNAIARAWSLFFENYPLILGPVATIQPFPVGFDLQKPVEVLNALRLVLAANLLGLPAAVVPAGVVNGLPQSVQLIGNRYREDLCLDAAEAIEQRLGTVTPIDPR
jgi:amidase